MEVGPGGGSDTPEPEAGAAGRALRHRGRDCGSRSTARNTSSAPGGYAYIPPGCAWRLHNGADTRPGSTGSASSTKPAPGIAAPEAFVTSDRDLAPIAMPDTEGRWATTRFVEPDDLRHDMHVNIVTFQPGGVIPFEETHVMEHGLYVLEGTAVYKLNRDWVEVEAGDFMWLRAFCPQACYAAGPGPFRYLLYKDVNRHARLRGPGAFGALK